MCIRVVQKLAIFGCECRRDLVHGANERSWPTDFKTVFIFHVAFSVLAAFSLKVLT